MSKPSAGDTSSRRTFLKSSAGLMLAGAAVPTISGNALAQRADSDPQLARLQGSGASCSKAAW